METFDFKLEKVVNRNLYSFVYVVKTPLEVITQEVTTVEEADELLRLLDYTWDVVKDVERALQTRVHHVEAIKGTLEEEFFNSQKK